MRGLSRESESESIQESGLLRDGNACITYSNLCDIKIYGLWRM